jgi:hypothetical protein
MLLSCDAWMCFQATLIFVIAIELMPMMPLGVAVVVAVRASEIDYENCLALNWPTLMKSLSPKTILIQHPARHQAQTCCFQGGPDIQVETSVRK